MPELNFQKNQKDDSRNTMARAKRLILGIIITLGAVLGIISLIESTNNGTLKKILGGALVAFVVLLEILNLIEPGQWPSNPPAGGSNTESNFSIVTEVVDGDTVVIDGNTEVRLIGIDAPESGECYYEEARTALRELVSGKNVKLEKDISGKDNFGRLLRYIFLPSESPYEDDLFVNDYLLDEGYADILPKTQDRKYRGIMEYSRNQAITNRKGIWENCQEEEEQTDHPLEANDLPTDPDCLIKGNISKDGYGKTYFLPNCANYKRTKIDFSKGEVYFCTEEEAQKAGFEKAAGCE